MINVVLFEPEIPGNTGNIMRTCAATGTKLHLIKPLGFSLDESYIKRSGANYIKDCSYTVYENWEDLKILKDDLEHCLRIPMNDRVRALNLSNCAAIMVYEVLRQQDYNDLLRTEPFKGEDFIETGIDASK